MNRCASLLVIAVSWMLGCADEDGPPKVARALGPFVEADFQIYELDGQLLPFREGKTSAGAFARAGTLRADLEGVKDDALYLIEVKGGSTLDPNLDGEADPARETQATSHSLLWGSELRAGNTHVTVLTELSWIYTRTLVGEVEPEGLRRRLDEIAGWLIASDIDGDGAIDARDILAFEPGKNTAQLSFPLSSLSALVDVDGTRVSLMDAYQSGDEDGIAQTLTELFGSITPNPDPERYARWSRIAVDVMGHGSVTSDNAQLIFERGTEKVFSFDFVAPTSERVALRAVADEDSSLVAWRGCAEVSEDQQECFVRANRRSYVTAVFGPKEVIVNPDLVDLTRTDTIVSGETIEVRINHADQAMVEALAELAPGQPIVSGNGRGFLRQVTRVERISDYRYVLETSEIPLTEVLQQGTVYFWKQLVEADVLPVEESGDEKSAVDGQSANTLRLVPSGDPSSSSFTLRVGPSAAAGEVQDKAEASGSLRGSVRIAAGEGLGATVDGEVTLRVAVEAGLSASLTEGLEYARFIPEVQITGSLGLTSTGTIGFPRERQPLGTLAFRPITVPVGPLPVVLVPKLTLYIGASGTLEASLTLSMESEASARFGFVYNKNAGVNAVRETHSDARFLRPTVTGELTAEAFLDGEIEMTLYDATGPAISLERSIKITASPNIDPSLEETCERTASVVVSTGLRGQLLWDVANSKLGRLLGLRSGVIAPSFELFDLETPLARWNEELPCPDRPQMVVEGFDIIETVTPSSPALTRQYIVRNDGDAPLTWSLDYLEDTRTAVTVSGSQTLRVGQTATVRVSLSVAELDGVYENFLEFENDNATTTLLDTPQDDKVTIQIRLTPESDLAAPTLESAVLISPTIAGVEWSYENDQALPLVRGYYLQYTEIANVWGKTLVLQGAEATSAEVASLLTDQRYWFRVAAYGDNQVSPYSAPLELAVPGIAPSGDCRAFFTGALVADNFVAQATSEIYVEDAYSEYVGAGDYTDNNRAFPKSVASTFDGIAVDRGTKVTIFSEPDFQGTKRLEMVGPAVINNALYMADPVYSGPVEADWKEPLQSEYPQSVRMWSADDMHAWSYGSLIVECGYD